jgi:sodium-dependent dicarboxylate transporter 2/3/5
VADTDARRTLQDLGLVAGPVAAIAVALLLPEAYVDGTGATVAFSSAGRVTAAAAVWMAIWWLTEAISIHATALLPLALLPLFGATTMSEAAAPYAHELIFLFMGGFLIALAMERWGLHRRIALSTLLLVGEDARRVVGGFMLATAALSMWVSNTATAIMLLPVAKSVVTLVAKQHGFDDPARAVDEPGSPVRSFAVCLLLGIAYAASIGGMGTPIGTPPNVLMLSYVESELGIEIGFARWMLFALPLVALFLPLAWWLLTRVLHPMGLGRIEGGHALVRESLAGLGGMNRAERLVLVVFVSAALLWMTRPLLARLEFGAVRPFDGLTDAGIAMLAALVLFVLPAGRDPGEGARRFVLDWPTAMRLPWGILVLFGGGLSLAAAIRATGVGELLASRVRGLEGVPAWAVIVVVVAGIVFLTELTSNTATTATLVPLLAAIAPGLGIDPLQLVVPAALAASCAFMLPVATPPNAIVFGSGWLSVADMSRAGFWLNWIAIVLITLAAQTLLLRLLLP